MTEPLEETKYHIRSIEFICGHKNVMCRVMAVRSDKAKESPECSDQIYASIDEYYKHFPKQKKIMEIVEHDLPKYRNWTKRNVVEI